MRLGLDLDDTITDIRDDMINLALEYDKSLRNNGIINKDNYYIAQMFDWNEDEKRYFRFKLLPSFVMKAKIRVGVLETLNKLHDNGVLITIITSRSDNRFGNAYEVTYNWLKENNIPFDNLIVGCKEKGEKCKELGIDLFIDDDINNILSLKKNGIKSYLIYNGYDFDTETDTIYNFKDLIEIILGKEK